MSVEGLKMVFSHGELVAHCQSREQYHRDRELFYKTRVAELQAGDAQAQPYTNGDPVRSLTESMKQHQRKAETFQLLGSHLLPDSYILDDSELSKLEYIDRLY